MNRNIFKCQVKTIAQCKQKILIIIITVIATMLQLITVKLEAKAHSNVQYKEFITTIIRDNKYSQFVKYNPIFYAKTISPL